MMSPEEKLEAVILQMLAAVSEPQHSTELKTAEGLHVRILPKGTVFAHSGQPLSKLYLLLSGSCRVLNYSYEGKRVFAGTVSRPQIFGLYELVNGVPEHTATLECVTDCRVVEAESDKALSCLKNRPMAAFGALRFLAIFTDELLSRSNRLTMHSERENLLLYLYTACHGKPLPMRLPVKKEELAELLNLNLRTLYRRLDELEAAGFLHRSHGKIEVDETCWRQIAREAGGLLEK